MIIGVRLSEQPSPTSLLSDRRHNVGFCDDANGDFRILLIPLDVAHHSGMISRTIFRDDAARGDGASSGSIRGALFSVHPGNEGHYTQFPKNEPVRVPVERPLTSARTKNRF